MRRANFTALHVQVTKKVYLLFNHVRVLRPKDERFSSLNYEISESLFITVSLSLCLLFYILIEGKGGGWKFKSEERERGGLMYAASFSIK